jgi:hypothetical protein
MFQVGFDLCWSALIPQFSSGFVSFYSELQQLKDTSQIENLSENPEPEESDADDTSDAEKTQNGALRNAPFKMTINRNVLIYNLQFF